MHSGIREALLPLSLQGFSTEIRKGGGATLLEHQRGRVKPVEREYGIFKLSNSGLPPEK